MKTKNTQDLLIPEAIKAIRTERKASTTWLRERFGLGYTRASKIMNQLEAAGVVGPSKGAEQRDILPEPAPVKTTYLERVGSMNREAAVVEVETINKSLEQFGKLCHTMEKTTIDAANKSREIGIHLQTMCGHDQLPFSFWKSHCEGKIDCTFEQAKNHISIAKKMPNPVETIAEAAALFQTLMFAGNLLESPERDAVQQRSTVSIVERFFKEVTIIRGDFKKALKERPMEDWEPKALDSFLSETEWLSIERDRAEKLRQSKN
jgi:hypothetical protein